MSPQVPNQQRRSFNQNELVFAKVYCRNTWKWAPGVILEKIGGVMYNVLVDHRVLRSHINQLRGRTVNDSPSTGTSSTNSRTPLLPLDVLLGAWDLPKPSACTSVPSVGSPQSLGAQSSQSPTLQPIMPTRLSSTPNECSTTRAGGKSGVLIVVVYSNIHGVRVSDRSRPR